MISQSIVNNDIQGRVLRVDLETRQIVPSHTMIHTLPAELPVNLNILAIPSPTPSTALIPSVPNPLPHPPNHVPSPTYSFFLEFPPLSFPSTSRHHSSLLCHSPISRAHAKPRRREISYAVADLDPTLVNLYWFSNFRVDAQPPTG